MSDYSSDSSVEEEVLRENGMTREEWMEAKEQEGGDPERTGQYVRGSRAHKIDKVRLCGLDCSCRPFMVF